MKTDKRTICILLACIIAMLSLAACKKEPPPEVEYLGESGIFGENVYWLQDYVTIKDLDKAIPLLRTVREDPATIPDSVYEWARKAFPKIDRIYMPTVPDNYEFSMLTIYGHNEDPLTYSFDFGYMATIDVMNPATNTIEPIRFSISFNYTNRVNESETVKEFAHGSPLTDDGKLYNEYIEYGMQCLYFDLNPGIGEVMALSRTSETVLLPYEYLEELCQYSMISLVEEAETSGTASPDAQEQPSNQTFFFDTYTELFRWMYADTNEQKADLILDSGCYQYVNEVAQNRTTLSIPYLNGSPMHLREKEGFSGIVFMTSELYRLPWIWYYGDIDGNEVVVKQACLSQKYLHQTSGRTASQWVGQLAPDAPNIHNADSFSTYKEIKEEMISLSGDTVAAMIYELKNDERISVAFILNGGLYMVTAKKEVLNRDFWSAFTMDILYNRSD